MVSEIKVPEAGFNIPECTVIEWKKDVGEPVQEGETVVALENDKLSVDVPAEISGMLHEIRCTAGETAQVGSVLGIISTDREGAEASVLGIISSDREDAEDRGPLVESEVNAGEKTEAPSAPASRAVGTESGAREIKASPAAKIFAKRENVDLADMERGSGPGGRIVKGDVISHIERAGKMRAYADSGRADDTGDEEKIPFTGWRGIIAERMTRSVREVPQYFQCIEADITDLAGTVRLLRERDDLPRITYLPFLIKAIVAGMDLVPAVNAYVYEDGFVLKKTVNVGVAVDLGEKLVVPVVKNVRVKSVVGIAREIGDLAERSRKGLLEAKETENGTVTVTNVGVYGIHTGIPIILQPQAAIISMNTIREVLRMDGDTVEKRKVMMLGASFDHRAVNGGPAARFMREVKANLENPHLLLINIGLDTTGGNT